MSQHRRLLLGVVLLVTIALMVVLGGGLSTLKLLPGKPLPIAANVKQAPDSQSVPPVGWGKGVFLILVRLLLILGLAGIVFFAVISRRFRVQLIVVAILIAILVFALSRISPPKGAKLARPKEQEMSAPAALPPANNVQVEIPPVRAANWGVVLIAVGSAFAITGIALLLALKVYPAIKKRREEGSVLDDLGQRASEAVQSILAGDDPRTAVLRCYKEMSDILSRERRMPNFSYFTPREFASHLRASGMHDEHVDRLTTIFEQVRYGGRGGTSFAAEAVSCLKAIQWAYVTEEGG